MRTFLHLAVAAGLTASLAGASFAAAKPAAKAAAAPKCPVCKMPLSATKSKANPVAVVVKGKTFYCCSKCNMHMKAAAKPAAKK